MAVRHSCGEASGSRRRVLVVRWYDGTRRAILSAPAHNAAFALFIGGILAYGAAFAWYMLDRFDLVNLVCAQRSPHVLHKE